MNEKVVFEQTIDGLFLRGLGRRLTPGLKAELKLAGLDLTGRLLPAYPFDVWMRSLEITARSLYPALPAEESMFLVGTAFIEGYKETFLGRAVLGVVRVLGPHRAMLRATQSFRSGNNYTQTTLKVLDVNVLELWMNEVGPWPSFTAGIVHAALSVTGVTPKVEVLDHDGQAATYRVSWTLPAAG
jgi:uncharacterized protein (TIGR02265 family)